MKSHCLTHFWWANVPITPPPLPNKPFGFLVFSRVIKWENKLSFLPVETV